MKNILIRQARGQEEIRQVFSIRKEVFVHEQKMFQESDRDDNDNNSSYLIAKSDGLVVGTVRVFPLGEDSWVGGRLAVRNDFRGTLAGTFLVKEAVKFVKIRNCKKFTATIQEKNVGFFKRLGWKPVGTVVNHLGLPHQIMEIDLGIGGNKQ